MDFDPRDYTDPRDQFDKDGRDRDEDSSLRTTRGSSSHRALDHSDEPRDRDGHRADHRDRDDVRSAGRERGTRERADAREAFTRGLTLPRGRDREIVRDSRDREYRLRGSESRTLATVGAFRVVPAQNLRDHNERPADPRQGDLRHLGKQGLIETFRIPGYRGPAVVLTERGRDLLEANRDRDREHGQNFYAGLKRERELEHDAQLHRAYEKEGTRLASGGAEVERVRLDYELKSEYQEWLHERDRDRPDYDGRPDRDTREVEGWAREHDLPYFDDRVHFPDFRIQYRDVDGHEHHKDVEVTTEHYRGAHGAAVARTGFSCHRRSSARIRGAGGGGGSRGGNHGQRGLAEELLK
ncbi:MAG TPA: hypothetical protein VM096_18510 [Vicinamibacterales bacterium]|nr:hypothetical protein [Vicinamibacterales bacterium]